MTASTPGMAVGEVGVKWDRKRSDTGPRAYVRRMAVDQEAADSFPDLTNLSEVLGRLARDLQGEHGNVEATLQAIASAAVTTVPHAEDCGITYVIGRDKVQPRAWTGDVPKNVDTLQERLGEGPCMDAVWHQQVVRVDDVGADERWPRFAQEAKNLGVGSMMCFQLFVMDDHLGALNLYSPAPHAFNDESRDIGLLFAGHAAVALAGAEHEEHMRAGMSTRELIGQAKGILMERHKVTSAQAFALLVRTSSLTNRKINDIAEELSATGQLPS